MNARPTRPLAALAVLALAALAAFGAPPLGAEGDDVVTLRHDDGDTETAHDLDSPWQVAISPDGVWAYVAATGDDRVTLFARDPATGDLEPRRNAGGDVATPYGIAFSGDSQFAYVAGNGDDAVYVLKRGGVGPSLLLASKVPNGLGPVTQLAGPTAVAVSPDDRHVYVAAADSDAIDIFSRDATTGALGYLGYVKQGINGVVGIEAVAQMVFSSDGRSLYCVTPASDTLAAFRRDPASGALTFQGFFEDGVAGVTTLDAVQGIAVRPGDGEVWTAGSEGLTVFSRSATGLLVLVDTVASADATGIAFHGRDVVAVTAPTRLYVATLDGRDLVLPLVIQTSNGQGLVNLDGMRAPFFDAEGGTVYVVARNGDSVAAFETGLRNAAYLRDGRFRIEAAFTVPAGTPQPARPQKLTDDTVVFSFLDPANKELVIKVLDACPLNARYWVFSGGLTNVAVTLKVTDTRTGTVKTYTNPPSTAFPPKLDTGAFATCP